ncbi:MAG: D-sedoheptulose 7-phosphate isomerase [Cytophagaceae bacterium]|nr:D-sedoheptulose 7-phosphate isomerase [Cytophagaceae bacterium]MDW8456269.1 D-sedoheptulose 7-phosphate isomerase [Cytophagaceae bacterium]
MNTTSAILYELKQAEAVLQKFMEDEKNILNIERAAELMASSVKNGGLLISCGNGGSNCDAMHFAEELTGRYRSHREPIAAVAIADPSYITCTANDYGYSHIFSRYVKGIGRKGDVLLAISTSGHSENVIKAAEAAREKQMKVVALTGNDGGKLGKICDVEINVPYKGYSDRIQEVHIKIIHILILLIEKHLGNNAG